MVIKASSKKEVFCFRFLLTVSIFIVLMMIGSLKSGFHVDEMYTFGLSNHQFKGNLGPDITDEKIYNGSELWSEYTTVSEDHRFDYANVWENQRHDVHPPLYYAIIHTVYSFFPGTFNFQYALAVNAAFALIVFWQMVWLFNHFINNRKLAILFSLMFTLSMGFVNTVAFLRMYVLLTVWTNALIILFCKYTPEEARWKYYVSLGLILLGGAMTQYYFMIFATFACAAYAIRTALKKNWKKIFLSAGSVMISAVAAVFIFPWMLFHIFMGYRGKEAFANLSENGFWKYIWNYLNILDLRVFGNMFLLLLLMIIFLYIILSKDSSIKRIRQNSTMTAEYLQIVLPVIGYILIIAKISPFKTDRYVANIIGLAYLAVFSILILLARYFSRQAVAGIFIVSALVLFCSYRDGIEYLFLSEKQNIEKVAELGNDIPCIYIYDESWKITPNYIEMTDLNNIVFVNSSNLDVFNSIAYQHFNDLLLYVISDDTNKIIKQILEANPGLNKSEKLFTRGDATAYHLN